MLSAQQQPSQKPQVKVNMLNVCTPSADDQKEIVAALGRIPKQPLFSQDFEVDRGRSTLDETPDFLQGGAQTVTSSEPSTSNWVRIRREFGVQAQFSTVQYSFSSDGKNMSETLTFRVRDPKDLMQVTIEDSASAVTTPAAMLGTNTPVGDAYGGSASASLPASCPAAQARKGLPLRIRLFTSHCSRVQLESLPTIAACWECVVLYRRNCRESQLMGPHPKNRQPL